MVRFFKKIGANEFVLGNDSMDLYNIVFTHGQNLFTVLKELVAHFENLTEDLLTMAKFCVECFEMANNVQILDYFSEEILSAWMELFAKIIKTPIRYQSPVKKNGMEKKIDMDNAVDWKIKKTIFRNLARYLQQCNQLSKKGVNPRTKKIIDQFTKKIVPVLLQETAALLLDDPMASLSLKTHCFVFKFLINVLNNSHCSSLIPKPNLAGLFTQACLPALRPTPDDLESFTSDPDDYLLQVSGSLADGGNCSLRPVAESLAVAICRLDASVVSQLLQAVDASDESLAATASCLLAVSESMNLDEEFDLVESLFKDKVFARLANPKSVHPFLRYLLMTLLARFVPILSEETSDLFFRIKAGGEHTAFSSMTVELLEEEKMNSVEVYALLKLAVAVVTEERANPDSSILKRLIMAVLKNNTLSSLAVTTALMHTLVSSNPIALAESAPLVLESMVSKWQSLDVTVSHQKSNDQEAIDKLDKNEIMLGRETCLESICNILNQISLAPEAYAALADSVTHMLKTCILQKDEQCFHRCVQLLSIIIKKSKKIFFSVASTYPIICYAYLGPPQVDIGSLSPADKSLMESLNWWSASEQTVESETKFFHAFLWSSKAAILDTSDPFGQSYLGLMISVATKASITGLKNNNNWEVTSGFRILTSIMELLKETEGNFVVDEAEAVRKILASSTPSTFIITLALRFFCTLIWFNQNAFYLNLKQNQFYRDLLKTFIENADKLEKGTKKDHKLLTLGIASLLLVEDKEIISGPQFSKLLEIWTKLYGTTLRGKDDTADEDDWNEEPVFAEAADSEEDMMGEKTVSEEGKDDPVRGFWQADEDSANEEGDQQEKTMLETTDEVIYLRDALYFLKEKNLDLLVERTQGLSAADRQLLQSKLDNYSAKTE